MSPKLRKRHLRELVEVEVENAVTAFRLQVTDPDSTSGSVQEIVFGVLSSTATSSRIPDRVLAAVARALFAEADRYQRQLVEAHRRFLRVAAQRATDPDGAMSAIELTVARAERRRQRR